MTARGPVLRQREHSVCRSDHLARHHAARRRAPARSRSSTAGCTGFVYQPDGSTPLGDVPVFAYYQNQEPAGRPLPGGGSPPWSRLNVPWPCREPRATGHSCSKRSRPALCASTPSTRGPLPREERTPFLPADETGELNVLLAGGLGTVRGRVVDPAGDPVAGARGRRRPHPDHDQRPAGSSR